MHVCMCYLDCLAALSIGVLCGVRLDNWTGVLDDATVFQHDLSLDARLDLLGGNQFGGGLLNDFLCTGRARARASRRTDYVIELLLLYRGICIAIPSRTTGSASPSPSTPLAAIAVVCCKQSTSLKLIRVTYRRRLRDQRRRNDDNDDDACCRSRPRPMGASSVAAAAAASSPLSAIDGGSGRDRLLVRVYTCSMCGRLAALAVAFVVVVVVVGVGFVFDFVSCVVVVVGVGVKFVNEGR